MKNKSKRNLFAEVREGLEAIAEFRKGTRRLRVHEITLSSSGKMVRKTRYRTGATRGRMAR